MANYLLSASCAALFLVACTTASPPPAARPEELKVPPMPEQQTPQSVAPPESKPRHPAGEVAVDEGEPPTPLGGPCNDPASCGKSGKVAVMREHFRMRPAPKPPCQTVMTTARNAFPNASYACVDGPRIFVATNCIACRLPTEDRFIGLVDDMTPSQLREAQKLAALPPEPLLTTTQEWSQAVAARR